VNPTGPDGGEKRVVRGGSWDVSDMNSRSAIRDGNKPTEKFNDIGFRIARSLNESVT
jgi:formylglycine-generating enzyme required for sulfatase activity